MKTSMTIERLRQVVRVLEALPSWAGFDMGNWKCGTSACAIGWAAQDPWFTRRGFTLTNYDSPVYKGYSSFDSVQVFFGIRFSEAAELFNPSDSDNSKQDVIDRIKAFCNTLERVSK